MFWHAVLLLLGPLSSLVRHLLRDDRDREILALRQQVLIVQRRLGKRPRLRPSHLVLFREMLVVFANSAEHEEQPLARSANQLAQCGTPPGPVGKATRVVRTTTEQDGQDRTG